MAASPYQSSSGAKKAESSALVPYLPRYGARWGARLLHSIHSSNEHEEASLGASQGKIEG